MYYHVCAIFNVCVCVFSLVFFYESRQSLYRYILLNYYSFVYRLIIVVTSVVVQLTIAAFQSLNKYVR